ncbi:MAG: ribosome biogenesis GTPase Der [Planctomycetota bacterium]
MLGRRLSVEDATPGVTRDRLQAPVERDGYWFDLIDTGGMGIEDRDGLTDDVEDQVRVALAEAAVAIFLVDIRAGITDLDQRFAREVRKYATPVVLVTNKSDYPDLDFEAPNFHRLGLGEPVPVSAREGRGLEELIEALAPHLDPEAQPEEPAFKVALVGARNAGKSTMVNALAADERVIVSEVPGTTRDAVDVTIEKDGKRIVLVDTAGFRRRAAVSGNFEFYSQARSAEAIFRSDVVCLILDATKPIGKIQKQLAGTILRSMRPCVIVANKWDLARDHMEIPDYDAYVYRQLPGLRFAPMVITTALTGKNALAMLDTCAMLLKQADSRLGTGEVTRLMQAAVEKRSTPVKQGRVGKVYYATQARTRPPTLVLFVNSAICFPADYRRYLVNQLQQAGRFPEVPVRIRVRERRRRDRPPDGTPMYRRDEPELEFEPDSLPEGFDPGEFDPADYADEPEVFEVPLGDAPDEPGLDRLGPDAEDGHPAGAAEDDEDDDDTGDDA